MVILVIVAIQFYRPARTNPPVDPQNTIQSQTHIPLEVSRVLYRSCGDCHSNQTLWPWYSEVAPVSWLVVSDVDEGRGKVNLSDWTPQGGNQSEKANRLLGKICEEVKSGDMPEWYYTPLHPNARLSPAEIQLICNWTQSEQQGSGTAPKKDSDK